MYSHLYEIIQKKLSHQKQTIFLSASAFFFFIAIMFSMVYLRSAEESLSSRIAPEVLRFHVLANSDTEEDQMLKLEVKQMLIETMEADLAQPGPPLSKDNMITYINDNSEQLIKTAEAYITERGYTYSVDLRLENCYFPTKIYGDVVFPCGYYDAVRVLIGKGSGKNWWCVLYPPLCLTDNAVTVVPDESKQVLENLLVEDDYSSLMKKRRVVFGDEKPASEDDTVTVHVRSRLYDLLTNNSGK